jgi:hypothetical protein
MDKAGFKGTLIFMQDYNIDNHIWWQGTHLPQQSADMGLKDLPGLHDPLYRELLCRQQISDNMAFIGTIK